VELTVDDLTLLEDELETLREPERNDDLAPDDIAAEPDQLVRRGRLALRVDQLQRRSPLDEKASERRRSDGMQAEARSFYS
jgi:hypothetical protein